MDKSDGEKPVLTLSEVLEESKRLRERSDQLLQESAALKAKIEEARVATEKTKKSPNQ